MFQRMKPGSHIAEKLRSLFNRSSKGPVFRIEIPSEPVIAGSSHETIHPSLLVTGADGRILFAADVDIQTCGRNEDHSVKLRIYEESGLPEHWLIFPADRIIVKRTRPDFKKRQVFALGDTVQAGFLGEDISVSEVFL